jgi:hypothetical protein
MAKEPNWSREELRVIGRSVSGLRAGEYPTIQAATRACRRELGVLRSRLRGRQRSIPARTGHAVYAQIWVQAREAGVTAHAPWWKPAERRLVSRYGRALARGRYAELAVAAKECQEEWSRMSGQQPDVFRGRTLLALSNAVRDAARSLGWHTGGAHRDPRVESAIMRHAKSLARGRWRSGADAARHCAGELDALYSQHPAVPRLALFSVTKSILRKCHDLGMPFIRQRWTADEDALARRYARALVEGRYPSGTKAAESCSRDLARLRAAQGHPRRVLDVQVRIAAFAYRLGYPHPYADWTRQEKAILDRHARGVLEGRHSSAATAAVACFGELAGHYRRVREAGRFRAVAGRSASAVLGKMHERVRELGRHGPPNRRWSERERQAAARWLRWYVRPPRPKHRRPLGQAVEGLKQDIEDMGCARSTSACMCRLSKDRRRAQGMA